MSHLQIMNRLVSSLSFALLIAMTQVNFLQAQAVGTEPQKEEEKNAQGFAWKSINLGSTLLEIKKTHPKTIADDEWLSETEKKGGVSGLYLEGESGINMALLRTYEDKVYHAIIIYDYDDISALAGGDFSAGVKLITDKLKAKLGDDFDFDQNEEEKQYQLKWEFKTVNREIKMIFDDKKEYARLMYEDTLVGKQIVEKAKKSADVGF